MAFALAAVATLAISCLGYGRAVLAALGVAERLLAREVEPVAFALGVGLLGWLGFFLALMGWLAPLALTALALPGIAAMAIPLRRAPAAQEGRRLDPWVVGGVVLVVALLGLDLVQVAAPPADADTLAYHFALPKEFLRAGRLVFVPRVGDGAVPLLLHMTYLAALGLGGESALILWAILLGVAAAWLFHALARRFLDRRWALALLLVLATMPATVFGSGSGQVELKLALFAMAGALAAALSAKTGDWRLACLAGLAAGFYAGAKYLGLLFVGAGGLVVLLQHRPLRPVLAYAAAALLAGSQWYVWNAVNSGDPVFPMLYGWLGARDHDWSAAAAEFLRTHWGPAENPAPRDLFWFLGYPFAATLGGPFDWDASRTGFGPFPLLVLPFALAGAWMARRRLGASPLLRLAAIAAIFYVVWYPAGISQRIRHLLPLYPLALVALGAAAVRAAEARRLVAPLAGAVLLTIAVQSAGTLVYARNYLHHLVTGESREAFLERNVAGFAPVPWINAHLGGGDRLLLTERQLVYLIEPPTLLAMQAFQQQVNLLPGGSDPGRFLGEIRRLGITHMLVVPGLADFAAGERQSATDELLAYASALVAAGCAEVVHSAVAAMPRSRTLPGLGGKRLSSDIVRIVPGSCPL